MVTISSHTVTLSVWCCVILLASATQVDSQDSGLDIEDQQSNLFIPAEHYYYYLQTLKKNKIPRYGKRFDSTLNEVLDKQNILDISNMIKNKIPRYGKRSDPSLNDVLVKDSILESRLKLDMFLNNLRPNEDQRKHNFIASLKTGKDRFFTDDDPKIN